MPNYAHTHIHVDKVHIQTHTDTYIPTHIFVYVYVRLIICMFIYNGPFVGFFFYLFLPLQSESKKIIYMTSPKPDIFINWYRLEVVDSNLHLVSAVSNDVWMWTWMTIERVSQVFGKIENSVWSECKLSLHISVCVIAVLSTHLYSADTWTTYRKNIKY